MLSKKYNNFYALLALLTIGYWLTTSNVFASQVDDLKTKINERNVEIEKIQKEIDMYQAEIEKTTEQSNTLKNEIKRLETTKKKLSSSISLTQNNIEKTNLNLERLNLQINDTGVKVVDKRMALGEIIRNINEAESASLIEITLANNNFSDFFSDIEQMETLQGEINVNLSELKLLKQALQNEETEKEKEKKSLINLKSTYVDQKQLVELNKSKTNQVLSETKNKEANYKKLLSDRLKKQQALEDEINNFEEQIRIAIDPSSLPSSGSGVLKWPLDKIAITQYFGNTKFASSNPQVYNGGGHNGVDFRASTGTPIKSSGAGIISGIGNTDNQCNGVSYGKWVLIRHENGLTTLYAHLSLIKVYDGQQVETGQVIGYSGDTGYSTGPHLHYAVFATQGVKVGSIVSKICGTKMILPVASHSAYLNPLSYL